MFKQIKNNNNNINKYINILKIKFLKNLSKNGKK